MYDLGNLLKQLREEKNVSMDKMIEDLKSLYSISIAKSTISKWENNKADPSMENAKVLCNYFNISLDYLLGLSKYKNKEEELTAYKNKMNEFAKNHNKNFYENKLLNSFNKLNDEGKNEAIKRVDELTQLNKYRKENNNVISHSDNEICATLMVAKETAPYVLAAHSDEIDDETNKANLEKIKVLYNKIKK